MSQSAAATASAAPVPTSAAAPPAPAAEVAQPGPVRAVRSTPQLLRRLSVGLVVLGLGIGLFGAATFAYLTYSLHRAESDTVQLIRVQKIETNLLGADATATNAFLVGGLEPAAQRAAYDGAISSTSALIAEAARAQPADAQSLAVLNQQVVAYAATIEQARANNRQGFPVGAQYLRTASAELRSDALPVLDLLVQANADRAQDAMDLRLGAVFVIVTLLALGASVVAHVWLSRRFKRRINPGVLTAAILLAVAFLVGLVAVNRSGDQVAAIRTGSFAAVNSAAQARIEANDAKANESLTLIARGSGAAFEKAWSDSAAQVSRQLTDLPDSAALNERWSAYTTIHQSIRKQDDGGSWDAAVATATGAGAESSNTAFNAFDAQLATYLTGVSDTTANALAGRLPGLVVAAVLTLLAGMGAALFGRRGVAARLEEYR